MRFDQLVPVVSAVGTADFNAEHVAAIGTRLRGLVSRVAKFEGDAVKADEARDRVWLVGENKLSAAGRAREEATHAPAQQI